MAERRVLDNWKEIAAYLGRTGKTCRNWEKEYGLPVHRLDGSSRAHVFAYADEVDRWKEEMLREKSAAAREITVRFSLKKLFVLVAVGLAILAAGMAVYFMSRGPHYDPERIIVATFENQTGDDSLEPLGRIAADWITQGFSRAGLAELVEVPPGKSAPGTPEEAERLRALAREAGAGTLVSGAYFLQGKTVSFHARVTDMSKGKLLKVLDPVTGAVEEPIRAIDLMKQKVLGALAQISDLKSWTLLAFSGQPPTYDAYKAYVVGREAHFRGDYTRAVEFYGRAAALDPSFKTAMLGAATDYFNLGQFAAGQKLVDEVDKARETLSPRDQMSLEFHKALYQGDLAGLLRNSRQMAPKLKGISLYQWGHDAFKNNRPREAVKALSMFDPEGIWMKDWPYYWLVMTRAQHMLGRYRTELKWARRGRRRFPEAFLFEAELRALAALGRIGEIDKLVDQILKVDFSGPTVIVDFGLSVLDRSYIRTSTYSPGLLMSVAGRELRLHGFRKESLSLLENAILWLQERPDEEKTKKAYREAMAFAYYGAEKWPEAQVFYEGLLKEDPENMLYLGSCGSIAARRGDREEALRISRQLEEIKKPYLWGLPAYYMACVASILGEKETAVRLLSEAFSQGMRYLYWNLHQDMDLDPLREYPPFEEMIRPKD